MDYQLISVNDLIPYINNSRTHSDEQVAQIAASIKEFGFLNPVLIDKDNGIIAGHGRLMAAKKLGVGEVPCVRAEHLTDAQKKAYVIADNQLALNAGWDNDLLKVEIEGLQEMDFNVDLLGFDDDFLDGLLDEPVDGLTDEDAVPDAPEDPVTVRGDIWQLGDHRLMCGDSTSVDDVESLLNGKQIDLIFSDPPYGVSYADKNKFLNTISRGNRIQKEIKNDHMTVDETGKLWADVFSLWCQYLNNPSSYYIASPQGGDLFLMMMMMMNDNNFPIKHTIIWNKNNHVLGRCDYNYKHEPILFGWKDTHKFWGKGEFKTSVWDIPKPQKSDIHPTMKPVELVENCIKNSSAKNQVVADMFLGSGTTLIASEKNGRVCVGMELDETYCDVIIKRWQEFTGKDAIHIESGKNYKELSETKEPLPHPVGSEQCEGPSIKGAA